jgi:hypothetical protein
MPDPKRDELPPTLMQLPSTQAPTGDPSVTEMQSEPPSAVWRPTIPGYEILGQLGQGGMGVVFKARQINANRLVALKMIRSRQHATMQDRIRFRLEAEAVARLQHPNIVQLYEVGEHDGLPFFSLEFVDGGTLDQQLGGKPMQPDDAAKLVEQLAGAIHFAHLHGVVHRDLKPANVLLASGRVMSELSEPTATPTTHHSPLTAHQPKITDFGLAKQMDSKGDLSHTGAILGTPSYMAPEQAEGRVHDVGPHTDVYALGVILYECLTGQPPFAGGSVHEMLARVSSHDPVSPRQLIRGLSRDLDTICLKCLEKTPAKRYASARDLAEDLRAYLDGRPIKARPVGRLERVLKWTRRRPAAAMLLAFCFIALNLFIIEAVRHNRALVAEQRNTERQRDDAVRAKDHAEEQHRHAEEQHRLAVAAQRQAQMLNLLAYLRVSTLAGKLATRPWVGPDDVRSDFQFHSEWITAASDNREQDPVVLAMKDFNEELKACAKDNAPSEQLKQHALTLARSCGESWQKSIGDDLPEMFAELRSTTYGRTLKVLDQLAAGPVESARLRQDFWGLYWGEMAMVETRQVADIMVGIGNYLNDHRANPLADDARTELKRLTGKLREECAAKPAGEKRRPSGSP